jgi:PAS domain S-box-containing protein
MKKSASDIVANIDYKKLFESGTALFLVLSTDFIIIAVTDAYLKATMTKREEIIGRGIFEVFPDNPDDTTATGVGNLKASLNRVLQYKKSDAMAVQKYDILRPESEGGGFEERYWSPLNSPVFESDENIAYIIHQVEDVTEFIRLKQKETGTEKLREELIISKIAENIHLQHLKESEERFQKIFEESPEAKCISVVENGRLVYVNSAFEKLLGLSKKEIIGKTATELNIVSPEERDRIVTLVQENGLTNGIEANLRNVNGELRNIQINTGIAELDGVKCFLSSYIDTTERKESEQKIVHLNKELEQNINELQRVNMELEAFSYSISHDLRTPIRAIHGYTGILRDDYSDNLDESGKQVIRSIMRNAKKMGQLIDDLLAFSKIGRKELHFTSVNTDELVKHTIEELKKITPNLKTTIQVNELLPVQADYNLLTQVFINLISNAIKYSEPKEDAIVEIGSYKKDSEIIYYIKDNGVGFDMKYYNKLFGVFQRLHSEEAFTGTGVGLALVKRIVNKHGGHVWAESELGIGTTFYFSLNNL